MSVGVYGFARALITDVLADSTLIVECSFQTTVFDRSFSDSKIGCMRVTRGNLVERSTLSSISLLPWTLEKISLSINESSRPLVVRIYQSHKIFFTTSTGKDGF